MGGAPLMWMATAFVRGEFGQSSRSAGGVLAGTDPGQTSLLVDPDADGAASTLSLVPPAPSVFEVFPGNPISDFIRFFVGNGTADRPDAGLLWGRGFSYTASTCPGTTVCNGGRGGILGDGGDGFNGGSGGAAGWFGTGGDGGMGVAGTTAVPAATAVMAACGPAAAATAALAPLGYWRYWWHWW